MTRPLMSLDMDGVIVTPLLGNLVLSRRLLRDGLPDQVSLRDQERAGRLTALLERLDWLRYTTRPPLPDVRKGLQALSRQRDLVVVTARSWRSRRTVEAWLARHDLANFFQAVYCNDTDLKAAQYKLWTARRLGVHEHVDDDGSVAHYLASQGIPRVFLRDWPRNRGLPYPPQVVVVSSLEEVAQSHER